MAIVLKSATASCRLCDHKSHQISDTSEHAIATVTEAMRKHTEAEHPDEYKPEEW